MAHTVSEPCRMDYNLNGNDNQCRTALFRPMARGVAMAARP